MEAEHLRITRAAYDVAAADYARLLPDLRGAETLLDLAMVETFAQLTLAAGPGPVVDLGCGTGRMTAHLHSLGVDVSGIDLSPTMVDFARQHHPELRFSVGTITDVALPDASLAGVVAWYSTIHTPPEMLPSVLGEFTRLLVPGGHLLLGFHVGPDSEPRSVTFRDGVSVDAYDIPLERMADLAARAGLGVHAELLRAPEGREKRPQASLIAVKPHRP